MACKQGRKSKQNQQGMRRSRVPFFMPDLCFFHALSVVLSLFFFILMHENLLKVIKSLKLSDSIDNATRED